MLTLTMAHLVLLDDTRDLEHTHKTPLWWANMNTLTRSSPVTKGRSQPLYGKDILGILLACVHVNHNASTLNRIFFVPDNE